MFLDVVQQCSISKLTVIRQFTFKLMHICVIVSLVLIACYCTVVLLGIPLTVTPNLLELKSRVEANGL